MIGRLLQRLRQRSERGAAALEFALVMVPLLYLVLGVITYGYVLAFRQTMSQAASEGARAAATAAVQTVASQTAAATASVSSSLNTYGVSCGGGNLTRNGSTVGTCAISVATCTGDPSRQCVTVALSYNYKTSPLIPVPGLSLAIPSNLNYTAVAEVS